LLLEKDSDDYKTVEKDLTAVNAKIEAAKNTEDTNSKKAPVETSKTNDSATDLSNIPTSTESGLSNLLDQQKTEAVIQDGALTTDQNLIEN